MKASSVLVLDGGSGFQPIAPVRRAPLGPFPQPPGYKFVLPFRPPGRDLLFYRGQFCGIRIPGAPIVPGCNASNPDLVMTCLLDHYPAEIQDHFLLTYAQDGFSHLQRSFGHAMPNDGWTGTSLDDFVALSAKAQSQYGLFVDQWIIGGGGLYNCNQDLSYWRPIIDRLCDAFIANGVVDTACVGWQLDQLFGAVPGNITIEVIAYIAKKLPQTVPLYTHWMNEALAWWKTGGEVWTDEFTGSTNVMDRFTWWWVMQPYLTGGHHQGNTTMARKDPKQYQDRLCDTLDYFGGDTGKGTMGQSHRNGVTPFKLDVFECTGQDQFDGSCSEDEGDMVSFLLMCTQSHTGATMSGYGNGCRLQDGSPL